MIGPILKSHRSKVLRMNQEFVHLLSPLDDDQLDYLLERASYQRQIDDGAGVLLGYAHDVDYPDHKNLTWLRRYFDETEKTRSFFYIDRVIIGATAQGRGLGRHLYEDVESFARKIGCKWLVCEVNTRPNNPASHAFHAALGFVVIGEADYPQYDASVRYYAKRL